MDDNKKSTTIWLRPSVISRMDGWLEADNCQSRSEFVDKALRFYLKGGKNAAKLAQRTRYVATRLGVELLADERSTLPATKKGYSMQMHM